MKVKELLEVLQKANEQGCGDIELSYSIPCLYVSEDSDIYDNEYRSRSESLTISLDSLLGMKKRGFTNLCVCGGTYDECSCWDYYDDRDEAESEENEEEEDA